MSQPQQMPQQPIDDMGQMGDMNQQPMDNMGQEPMMDQMPQEDMGEMDGMNQQPMDVNYEKEKKEIQKNIGKGCADFRNYQGNDKEELGKWISGMLDSLDGTDNDTVDLDNEEGAPENQTQQEGMPMESVIVKKKTVNEVLNDTSVEEDEPKVSKIRNKVNNTPFNNPDYGE